MTLKEYCIQYHTYGINAVPTVINHKDIRRNKVPFGLTVKTWHEYLAQEWTDFDLFANPFFNGIGIVCGKISGNIEVIDIDSKYQEHRNLFGDMQEMICNIEPELWGSLVIEKTVSGGYHLIYRCAEIGGNEKLANRLPNEADIEKAKAEGKKAPKQIGLIETRGMGGFCVTAPTPGYELIQGSFEHIPVISEIQREMLFDAAISLNEIVSPEPVQIAPQKQTLKQVEYGADDVPCWVDYNNKVSCLDLLSVAGWKEVSRDGKRIKMCHPAQKTRKPTAFIDLTYNFLGVFSTNTEFDTYNKYGGKGNTNAYTPFKIYAEWNHRGDYKAAAKDLYAQGYGTRKKPAPAPVAEKKTFEYKVKKSTISAGSETIAPTLELPQNLKDADTVFLFLENGKEIAEKNDLPHYIVPETMDIHGIEDAIKSLVSTLGKDKDYAICSHDIFEVKRIGKCLAYFDVLAKVYVWDIQKIDHEVNNDSGDIILAKDKMQKELMPILNFLISAGVNPLEDVWQLLYCFPSTARIQFLISTLPNKPQGLKEYCRQGLKARKQEDKEQLAAEAEENSVLVENGETLVKNYQGVLAPVCQGELSIPFQIPGENDNECEWIMCYLTRDDNDKTKQIFLRIDNEQIGSQAGLEKVFRNARIQFKANKAQIVNLNNALIPVSKTAEKNDSLGWHKDSGLWFWHNEAFCYKEKTFLQPNEISIIDHQGGSIYLPHCDTSRRSRKSQNDFTSSFAFRKSEITMHDISSWYYKQWGEQGVLVLLWGIASAYVDYIAAAANAAAPFFPLIYCQGQKGSGKTTMLEVLRFFYTRKIETISLRSSNNTAAAIQSILSKYSGVPILFDDFGSPEGKASTDIATGIGVSGFNRRVEAKRDMNDLSKVQDPTIYATLAYSSNYYPKDSSGAFQDRCMYFKFDRTVFSQEESEAFLAGLQRFESEGLCSAFIIEVISNRQAIEANFQATYKQLLAYFKSNTSDYEIGSRQISIYAMILTIGVILTKQGVSFSLNEKELKEAARAAIIKQHTTLQSKNPIQVFWEVVQAGIDAGIVTLGMYYDYRPNGYTGKNNAAKSIKGEVIIVNLPLMYRFYAQEMKRMGQEPEKKCEIEDEIGRSPSFVSTEIEGQAISRLSAWRFDFSDKDQEETKSKVTVALALKLGELQKQFGLQLKKTK